MTLQQYIWLVLYNLTIIFHDYKMKNIMSNIQWILVLNNLFDMTKGILVIYVLYDYKISHKWSQL
jgi:hypothetical protein